MGDQAKIRSGVSNLIVTTRPIRDLGRSLTHPVRTSVLVAAARAEKGALWPSGIVERTNHSSRDSAAVDVVKTNVLNLVALIFNA